MVHERPSAAPAAPGNAFDRALELHDLDEAAIAYALRHGEPESASYQAAWLKFRRGIRTADDLRRARQAAARRRAAK